MPTEATSLVTPCDSLDKEFLRESIKDMTAIMSSDWVDEGDLSSKEIQFRSLSLPIRCKIQGNWVDTLYNPTVGANLMSKSFALTCLGKEPRAPTVKSFRVAP
jgi:hypothetical protein